MGKKSDLSDIALKVEHVSKSFRLPTEQSSGIKQAFINYMRGVRGYTEQHVLKDISFEVKKGDFFGIVGRNGSGKSTLLKLISQIYTPDSGKITVNGSLVPFIELGVGFNPELTGRENVYLNGAMLGFSREQIDGMYDEIVEFAELHDFMDQKLKNYSSGMQVRLAFSVAIKAQGDILVLDEVLAVGDEAFQQKCFSYFASLKEQKKTVVLVTHDMGSVQRFCDKAMMIEKGVIKAFGDPGEVADTYTEDNIRHIAALNEDAAESGKDYTEGEGFYNISLDIADNDQAVDFSFKCNRREGDDLYVGFSLFTNGSVIAELNSRSIELSGDRLNYRLMKSIINPGSYEVTAGLFRRHDREMIAMTSAREKFIIKGYDEYRGSGVRLPDNWKIQDGQ